MKSSRKLWPRLLLALWAAGLPGNAFARLPGHEAILQTLIRSPLSSPEQKSFLEDFPSLGVSPDIQLVFQCSALESFGAASFRCRIGTASPLPDEAGLRHHGVDASLSGIGSELRAESISDYDFTTR